MRLHLLDCVFFFSFIFSLKIPFGVLIALFDGKKYRHIQTEREGETLMRSKSADQTIHGCYSVTSPLTTSTIYTTNEN